MTKLDRMRMMFAVVAALALVTACGDDDDDDDDTAAVDAGTDSGAPPGPMDAMCGAMTCEGISVVGQNLDACCPEGDPADDCGIDTESAVLQGVGIRGQCVPTATAPGAADETCPATALTGLGNVPGCCQADNECGFLFDLTTLGGPNFGCQPWQVFTDTQLGTVEGIEDPNTPQPCGL